MPRPRPYLAFVLLVAALLSPACGDDTQAPTTPTVTPPEINEPFDGTLTVHGAAIHSFTVQRPGTVKVTIAALDPDTAAILGLALGTWNGLACDIKLASTTATLNTTVTGTASTIGNFCAYIHDVGNLTAPLGYQIVVTHF